MSPLSVFVLFLFLLCLDATLAGPAAKQVVIVFAPDDVRQFDKGCVLLHFESAFLIIIRINNNNRFTRSNECLCEQPWRHGSARHRRRTRRRRLVRFDDRVLLLVVLADAANRRVCCA